MVSKQTRTSERTTLPGRNVDTETSINQQVATTNGGNGNGHALVAGNEIEDWMQGYENTGAGLSQKKVDNLVPLAALIQVNAKRANPNEAVYIPGCESGMLYVPALAEQPFIDCRKGKWGPSEYNANGILIQACFQENSVFEWGKRVGASGGGFKKSHPLINDDVEKTMRELGAVLEPDPQNPDKKIWGKGDRTFVETRQFALLLHVEREIEKGIWQPTGELLPISLNFFSTGHTFAKGWMFQMNRRIFPTTRQRADMWLTLWRLHTKHVQKTKGSCFEWFSDCVGWVRNPDHREQGKSLHLAFVKGEKEMAHDDEGNSDSGDATYASSSINPDDMDVAM